MNRYCLALENSKIDISFIVIKALKIIPHNNLNWYILELSASGLLESNILKMNMLELTTQIRDSENGIKLSFEQLLEIVKRLDSIDECFIVGCNFENKKSISEIYQKKNDYIYIFDYFDSTLFKLNTLNLEYMTILLQLLKKFPML